MSKLVHDHSSSSGKDVCWYKRKSLDGCCECWFWDEILPISCSMLNIDDCEAEGVVTLGERQDGEEEEDKSGGEEDEPAGDFTISLLLFAVILF